MFHSTQEDLNHKPSEPSLILLLLPFILLKILLLLQPQVEFVLSLFT